MSSSRKNSPSLRGAPPQGAPAKKQPLSERMANSSSKASNAASVASTYRNPFGTHTPTLTVASVSSATPTMMSETESQHENFAEIFFSKKSPEIFLKTDRRSPQGPPQSPSNKTTLSTRQAAIRIQSFWRRWQFLALIPKMRQIVILAMQATKIQSWWRRRKLRMSIPKLAEMVKLATVVMRIQSCWRRKKMRKKLQELIHKVTMATRIQLWFRRKRARGQWTKIINLARQNRDLNLEEAAGRGTMGQGQEEESHASRLSKLKPLRSEMI
jgi:hypothetical protein